MAKRIVFCADGTWQAPLNNTNVYRLHRALAVTGDQVTFYDYGVGADASGLGRILDGAFGQQILQRYRMDTRRSPTSMRRATRYSCSDSGREPIRPAALQG
jgi:uncharacterized protein (DUF2235 family)